MRRAAPYRSTAESSREPFAQQNRRAPLGEALSRQWQSSKTTPLASVGAEVDFIWEISVQYMWAVDPALLHFDRWPGFLRRKIRVRNPSNPGTDWP
jgi:hypothetical protein